MENKAIMNTIQLQGNVTFEQYQMAVNVLEAIGLKVKREEKISNELLASIEQGIAEAEAGKLIPNDEVLAKAEAICKG